MRLQASIVFLTLSSLLLPSCTGTKESASNPIDPIAEEFVYTVLGFSSCPVKKA